MPTRKPDPKNCPHRSLEFEMGGRVVACKSCGQRYHAMVPDGGFGMDSLDPQYYNVWILHRDRREWVPALAEPVKPQ